MKRSIHLIFFIAASALFFCSSKNELPSDEKIKAIILSEEEASQLNKYVTLASPSCSGRLFELPKSITYNEYSGKLTEENEYYNNHINAKYRLLKILADDGIIKVNTIYSHVSNNKLDQCVSQKDTILLTNKGKKFSLFVEGKNLHVLELRDLQSLKITKKALQKDKYLNVEYKLDPTPILISVRKYCANQNVYQENDSFHVIFIQNKGEWELGR